MFFLMKNNAESVKLLLTVYIVHVYVTMYIIVCKSYIKYV